VHSALKISQDLKKRMNEVLEKYASEEDTSPSYGFDVLRWAKLGLLKPNEDLEKD